MSSQRRRRAGRRQREWLPDHHWPADGGWPERARPPAGRGAWVAASVLGVLVVLLGASAYGLVLMKDRAPVPALQDSASAPCQAAAVTVAARCAPASPARAASSRPAPSGRSARPGGPPISASAAPRPGASTPAPVPSRTPAPSSAPAGSASPAPARPRRDTPGAAALRVLTLINRARAAAGLPAYTISAGLEVSSRRHSRLMAAGCGLSHQCPGEASLGARLTAAGVRWTSAGENIGEGGPEAAATAAIVQMAAGLTRDMLNEKPPDDGHRLNILSSSFRHIGIFVLRDAHGTVWMTQDFSN